MPPLGRLLEQVVEQGVEQIQVEGRWQYFPKTQ